MFKKKIVYVILCIVLLIIIPLVISSMKEITYDYENHCDCKEVSNKYGIEFAKDSTCYYGRNGLGQIKSYLIIIEDPYHELYIGNDKNHQYKEKLKLIDTLEESYKDYKLTIEYYTYKTNQSNELKYIIYNRYYLEKDNYVISGSVSTRPTLKDDYKNIIKDDVKSVLDESIK